MQKIYGIHPVSHFLEKHASLSKRLFIRSHKNLSKSRVNIVKLAKSAGIPVIYCDKEEFAHHLGGAVATDQSVLLEAEESAAEKSWGLSEILAKNPKRLLVLDRIQDPHNLGACIRSANALGVDAVITTRHHSASITPIVRKVACGGVEGTPFVIVNNLAESLKKMRQAGMWIVGTAAETEIGLYETDLSGPVAIVIGSESEGLRRLTKVHCDYLVRIPLMGTVASLNASVAAGIVLYEVARQQAQSVQQPSNIESMSSVVDKIVVEK